jgi:hypothetical protein
MIKIISTGLFNCVCATDPTKTGPYDIDFFNLNHFNMVVERELKIIA